MNVLRVHGLLFICLLMLAVPIARAQDMPIMADASPKPADANVKLPAYDVASVKQNKSDNRIMRIMNHPDGFSCSNIPLKTLIANAYGIRQDLISGGPGWVNSMGFDVEAKVAGPDVEAFKSLRPGQRNFLLRGLLEERFKLKLHSETKVLPMYDLIVAKGGPKLKPAAAPADAPGEEAKGPDAPKPHGMMTMGPACSKDKASPWRL